MNAAATKIISLITKRPKRKPRRRQLDISPNPPAPDTTKRTWVEGKDVFLFGGLGLAGYGVWQIYPPSAYVLVGGVFFAIGLYWYMGGVKNGTS